MESAKNRAIHCIGVLLAALCLFIAIRVEQFNARSHILPRRGPYTGKWRISSVGDRKHQEIAYRVEHHIELDEALTPLQQKELADQIANQVEFARQTMQFRDFMHGWALIQYLSAPALFCLSLFCLVHERGKSWPVSVMLLVISLIAIYLMISRDYAGA